MKKLLMSFFALFVASGMIIAQPVATSRQLFVAVESGNRKAVKKLLKQVVPLNELNNEGKTALDVAIEYGYLKIAVDLAQRGAKVTLQDNADYLQVLVKNESRGFFKSLRYVVAHTLGLILVYIGIPSLILFGITAIGALVLGAGLCSHIAIGLAISATISGVGFLLIGLSRERLCPNVDDFDCDFSENYLLRN